MKNILTIIIFVTVIGLLAFAFIPGFIDKYQSKTAAKGVLDNVIDQDYQAAFERVYFYDKAIDLEPIISYEDAKSKWIQRVKDLREQGIYLVDYNQLRVGLDDTYPKGTVDLVIMQNGEKSVKKDVQLWFGPSEDKWKLGNFDYRQDDIEEEWENALSGNVN
ncbi:hypothetical protein E1I69_23495 [Bacillus timonensis]|uniref:DUF4878 domain-containing protein n=1 Tax=Bacillus timonensis TaxID=1033734 RepID=A0A4S3PJB6_9BACI|nr:hypothetical protein [Bacillus timonensis]THE09144.1 hypothetical protein E1I69_23495 [Bacillus timonensis]